jgi:uncharacterized protein YjbI with pentapeptide repeats
MELVQVQEPLVAHDAKLAGSTFPKCKLSGAVSEAIHMAGAWFHDASLAGAVSEEVTMAGASVRKADLAGLRFEDCKLTGMRTDGIEVEALLAAYRKSL